MITDKLLNLFFDSVISFLDSIPLLEVDFDFTVLNTFLSIVEACLYFFPWQKVLPILGIIILLQTWRIVVSIVKVIWQLLPLV